MIPYDVRVEAEWRSPDEEAWRDHLSHRRVTALAIFQL
jgi:hypothetical protein